MPVASGDASLARAYVLIAEMFQQEGQNAESQLQNDLDSSALSSFDVSTNRPSTIMGLYPEGPEHPAPPPAPPAPESCGACRASLGEAPMASNDSARY